MAHKSLKIIYGSATLGSPKDYPDFGSPEGVQKGLEALKSNGVVNLDTAQLYGMGKSESTIGEAGAIKQGFTVDTKWMGGFASKLISANWSASENIIKTAKESLEKLKTDKVDIFYLHSPDDTVPFEDTAKGVNECYKQGMFERFGLSNFSVAQTREMIEVCRKNSYVMPSVYQGNYSAAARMAEDELLPLLREHKMAFYAYSPIAGGFLAKDRSFVEGKQGRFAADATFGIYGKMYGKPSFLDFLDEWGNLAEKEGVGKVEMAYRWVNYSGALRPELGDGVIFGASKYSQLVSTIDYLKKGPLSDETNAKIDALWDTIKDDSIMDNYIAITS